MPSTTAILPVLAATTLVQALVTLACLTLPAIAPKVGAALGVDASLIGLQVSLSYGAAMMTSLAGGVLVRRFGACRISQAALLLAGAGAALSGLASLAGLAGGAALIGLGYGLTNPAASHLLAKSATAGNRNLVFSIKQTGVPLGGTVAGLMAPSVAVGWGWQWAVLLVALLAAAAAALLQPARARWDADRDPLMRLRHNPLSGLGLVWRRPRLRWLSLTALCFSITQLCLVTFLVTMLVAEVGLSLIEAGVVLSLVQVSGVAGRVLWGVVADRLRNGLLVLGTLALLMAVSALLTWHLNAAWPTPAVIGVLLLFGITAIGWNGVYLAEVARLTPLDQVGRVTGASLFFTFGGVLIGPTSFTLVYGALRSYTDTYALLGLLALVGLALVALAARRE